MKYLPVIAILLLTSLAACSSQTDTSSTRAVSISGKDTYSIDETIRFNITTNDTIRIPTITYWTPTGSWNIYKQVGNDWEKVEFLNRCFSACSDVCESETFCAPGGAKPLCDRVEEATYLEWDATELKDDTVLCTAELRECKTAQKVPAGRYKVRFDYRDRCNVPGDWLESTDNLHVLEHEFNII